MGGGVGGYLVAPDSPDDVDKTIANSINQLSTLLGLLFRLGFSRGGQRCPPPPLGMAAGQGGGGVT